MKQKEYLVLFVSALLLIILWVIFNIYHNYTTSTIDFNQEEIVIPIEGDFDMDAVNQIRTRKQVEAPLESEISSPSPSPNPSPSPTIEKEATDSSQLSPTAKPTP